MLGMHENFDITMGGYVKSQLGWVALGVQARN